MKRILSCFSLIILMAVLGCQRAIDYEEVGYAPPEAFERWAKYPYYGACAEEGFIKTAFTARNKDLYKRHGQKQILEIVKGNPEEAVRLCSLKLAEYPDDPEFLFTLSVAHCQTGSINKAVRAMEEAHSKGLPPGRFLAGPRDLIKPLTETDAFKEHALKYENTIVHGPLLGCVTGTSARFWMRTAVERAVQVKVSQSSDLSDPIVSEIERSDRNQDYTVIVEVHGLQPATTYYYDVSVNEESGMGPAYPSFTTYPADGEKARFQVAFGGGSGFVPKHQRMWDVINGHDPVALLLMGDNVYIDLPEEANAFHAYTYYRLQSRPEFRRLISSTSVYSIWDDHDAATNDVFMGPHRHKPSWKMSLFDLFKENWNNPSYGDSEWPGCWHQFNIADVDFFMLDGRFYRTNPYNANNPTMLGPVQKKWLLDQLRASMATFKVICSPVPWAFDAKGESKDTWTGYKDERNEIFRCLTKNSIDGVVLLSADRHRSDAWCIERPGDYALYEFESSRLTNEHVHGVMPGSLFGYNEKQSFGLLTFDTTLPDPTVAYQIYSIDDELVHTLEIKKSDISSMP